MTALYCSDVARLQHRLGVQWRGLVKEQEVWCIEQELAQRHAAAFATRQDDECPRRQPERPR